MINIKTLKYYYQRYRVPVTVSGNQEGDIFISCLWEGREIMLYDRDLQKPRLFRNPDTVSDLLFRNEIWKYNIDMRSWNVDAIYDRHKHDHEARSEKTKNVA